MSDLEEEVESNKIRDALIGLTVLYPELGLLKFGNVVVQKGFHFSDSVLILSGGASGFEPFFAGYVGKGMLTAAVQGDMFTSPPVKLVHKTLRELNVRHIHGTLVLVQSNMGNKLSFGLASAHAKSEQIRLKLLLVSESCTNMKSTHSRQDGLAGIVLVYKIAGAMADQKELLKDVYQFCTEICDNMCSSIVSLSSNLFQTRDMCICKIKYPANTIEIGKGIQGEAGEKKSSQGVAVELYNSVVSQNKFDLNPEDSVIFLLGNIGGVSKLDEWIVVKELFDVATNNSLKVVRFYSGSYLTSQKYVGLTLTILKVFDTKMLDYLDYPCSAPAWISMSEQKVELSRDNSIPSRFRKVGPGKLPNQGPMVSPFGQYIITTCLNFACSALISCENQLNVIDSEIGDGDTGSRLKKACDIILQKMKESKIPLTNPFAFFDYLANLVDTLVGGTIGGLYGILLRTMANSFINFPSEIEINANIWLTAFEKSVEALRMPCEDQFTGGMFTPLYEFAIKVREALAEGSSDPIDALTYGLTHAEEAVERTKQENRKYVDPGAHAVGIWLRAVVEGIKLRANVERK